MRIQVPLPGMELGHVNVYLLDCGDGYGLVDVGLATYESALGLLRGLREAGVKPSDISRVFVTHFHADHLTLVQLLWQLATPELHMGRRELEVVGNLFQALPKLFAEEYRMHGVPGDLLEALLRLHPMSRFGRAFQEVLGLPWRGVEDGERLKCGLTAVWTPGHTPGHVVYRSADGVYTGDHVLPTITPNISWFPLEGYVPLAEYLKSLGKVRTAERGLPAHGPPIQRLDARVDEIVEHHERRLREVLQALTEPLTTYQVARRVTWSAGHFDTLDPYNRLFALGETYAHLQHLEALGQVERREEEGRVLWVRRR